MDHQAALLKAIRYFGSQQALTKVIQTSQQQVNYWLNTSKAIPYEYVLKIHAATQGQISRYELAPQQQELNAIVDQFIAANVSIDLTGRPRALAASSNA